MGAPEHLSFDECKARLRAADVKPTHQRIMILHTLMALSGHPDAETIYEQLREQQPSLSLGTVYRTLEVFVEAGILKRFGGHHNKMQFDTNLAPHHHLIDQNTAEVKDFEDEELNRMIKDYLARNPIPGFSIDNFQLNIYGSNPQDQSETNPNL